MFSTNGVLALEVVYLAQQFGTVFTGPPDGSKFGGASRGGGLETGPHDTLGGTGQRGQKVSGGLPFWTVEAEVQEELLSGVFVAEIYLLAFIEDGDFVEDLRVIISG